MEFHHIEWMTERVNPLPECNDNFRRFPQEFCKLKAKQTRMALLPLAVFFRRCRIEIDNPRKSS